MRPYYFDLDQVQSRHDRAIAMARPIPRVPPVTTATLAMVSSH